MHWLNGGLLGMHMLWWLFWAIAIGLLFSFAPPVPKGRANARETPLGILQRRYSKGEIDSGQYEDRKARLTRDHAG